MRCGKPSSRARNFTKVPRPIHHFKAYRTKNDVEMFLSDEIEYKMYCDQQMQNEAIFMNVANSRQILAFRSNNDCTEHFADLCLQKCVEESLDQLSKKRYYNSKFSDIHFLD